MPCQFLFVDVSHPFAGEPCWEPCRIFGKFNLRYWSFETRQPSSVELPHGASHCGIVDENSSSGAVNVLNDMVMED